MRTAEEILKQKGTDMVCVDQNTVFGRNVI
jgi:hypothetical protein